MASVPPVTVIGRVMPLYPPDPAGLGAWYPSALSTSPKPPLLIGPTAKTPVELFMLTTQLPENCVPVALELVPPEVSRTTPAPVTLTTALLDCPPAPLLRTAESTRSESPADGTSIVILPLGSNTRFPARTTVP